MRSEADNCCNLGGVAPFKAYGEFSLPMDGPYRGGREGGTAQVDALLMVRHTREMANDLIAVDVHADDVGDYSVSEPDWYAVDDAGKVVLGPFTSFAECDRAIQDRSQHAVPKVAN